MANDHDPLYQLLKAACAPALLIFADENGKRPDGEFLTMAVRWADSPPAHAGTIDEEDRQLLTIVHSGTVELQAFGSAPYAALARLAVLLHGERLLDLAEELGVSVLSIGRLQDLPTLLDNAAYRRRAVLELGVSFKTTALEHVGSIETVIINTDITAQLPPE